MDISETVSILSNEGANDVNGHGTHVSGIVAAIDNSIDVVGVAAGANIVGVKVCDQFGGCYVSDVKAGVEYAANNFSLGDVANLSLGYSVNSQNEASLNTLENSITSAANGGLKFTISAGNSSDDANNYSPARIEHTNVWTVSAFNMYDVFASFSNYGNPPIEYGEPGVDILSLWKNGSTHTLDGTSQTAPHLAGLLLAAPNGIATDGFVSNDPDGDPDPIAVAKPDYPLSVYISGTHRIDPGVTDTWDAIVSHNEGPVSYQWYIQYPDDNNWYEFGNNASVTTYFQNFGSTNKSAAFKVDVNSEGESDSDTFHLQIYPEEACNSPTGSSRPCASSVDTTGEDSNASVQSSLQNN